MEELLRILLADEKKVTLLTVRFNELKKNIARETLADKAARAHLVSDIAALKKANSVIISHYLDEHRLTLMQIATITRAHAGEVN